MRDSETMMFFLNFLRKNYGDRTGAVHKRKNDAYQVLVSTVLSQRTKDANTDRASEALFGIAGTPENMVKLPTKSIERAIRPSGFYRQKAKNIKALSRILIEKYGGKVPGNREELLELPGVGWKTSAVVLSYSFGSDIVPVDTHVNRVSKRLGFADEKDDVEEVREKLEALIPKDRRYKTHLEIIHFGREVCRPINPLCLTCGMLRLCPFGKKKIQLTGKRARELVR